ncbi:MAG: aldehyde dehydrogenase family protein, partial [Pseudolysinimonas sp.]
MSGSPLDRKLAEELTGDLTASGGMSRPVLAPFTGKPLHDLPHSTVADVEAAAVRVRVAQKAWAAAGFAHRKKVLLKAHDLLLARTERLLDAVQTETGKTRGQAFEEVAISASSTRYAALRAKPVLSPQRRRPGLPVAMSTRVIFKPKGIVGAITPWNYPFALAIMDIAPALAA